MPRREDSVDIFRMLIGAAEKDKQERARLLESLGVKEFFKKGTIKIDRRTCLGAECKLCIKSCATNALYWDKGEIRVIEDMCVYCTACVLGCVVENCIQITRERMDGEKVIMACNACVCQIMCVYRNYHDPFAL